MNNYRRVSSGVLPLLKEYPGVIVIVVAIGMMASIFEGLGITLLIPVLQSLMQEEGGSETHSVLMAFLLRFSSWIPEDHRLWALPALILFCIILKNLFSYGNLLLSAWLKEGINDRLRCRVFHQLLSVEAGYIESRNTGEMLNTLSNETSRTGEAVAQLIRLITTFCTLLVYASLLLLISLSLTLIICVASMAISVLIQSAMSSARQAGVNAVQNSGEMTIQMQETLIGMRTIRAFGREDYEQETFEILSCRVRDAWLRLEQLTSLVSPLYEVLSTALVLVVLVFALWYDRNSLPAVLTLLFMLYRLQPQLQTIEGLRTSLRGLSASVENVVSFIKTEDKPYLQPGSLHYTGLRSRIRLDNVGYKYAGNDDLVLRRLNLTFNAGETTAIVGPSGAGKSTLIGIVCRLYDPTEGHVWIDDQCLQSINLHEWRRHFAIVGQDVHIFNATVAQNIAYGNLDASRDQIISAAKQAHADEFINQMPDGYDTAVGDRGIRLSGGQRQRLALARAIVRDPDLLILDEATNALDSISEQLIQEALTNLSRDRTVIVIAHRLFTIEQADKIVVLEQGQVVEQGTMDKLLNNGGLFHHMYRLQKSGFLN